MVKFVVNLQSLEFSDGRFFQSIPGRINIIEMQTKMLQEKLILQGDLTEDMILKMYVCWDHEKPFSFFLDSSSCKMAQESRRAEARISSSKALAPPGLSQGFLSPAEEPGASLNPTLQRGCSRNLAGSPEKPPQERRQES